MFGIRNGVINHGGRAADLQPEGKDRGFFGRFSMRSWASVSILLGGTQHLYRRSLLDMVRHGGIADSWNP